MGICVTGLGPKWLSLGGLVTLLGSHSLFCFIFHEFSIPPVMSSYFVSSGFDLDEGL